MKRRYATLLLCLILPALVFSQVHAKIGAEETPIYPLDLPLSDSFPDLEAFRNFFDSSDIVGMGEATHGTREFFETKARVFKFLVTRCGYRVFGIESSYGGCSYINDYIGSGTGNIDSVMLRFDFWTWRTEEVKALITWMRDFNRNRSTADKISFYGFDMQNFYSPVQYLDDFFRTDTTAAARNLRRLLAPVLSKTELAIYRLLQDKESLFQDSLGAISAALNSWMVQNRPGITAGYTALTFERLNGCAENFNQAVQNLDSRKSAWFRDSCMAFNILKIKNLENSKVFIWAHNGHVNKAYPEDISTLLGRPMGAYLSRHSGEKYFCIGFVFNRGSFQAVQGPHSIAGALFKYAFRRKHLYQGLRECTVPANRKNTFTNALSGTGYPCFFVPVASSQNAIFVRPMLTYDVGAVFMNYKRCSDEITAQKQFDGIIYIDQTTRARPLGRI